MAKFKIIITWILIVVFGLAGCATMQQAGLSSESSPAGCIVAHTIGGALIGGVAGALIGGTRGLETGLAIGAGAGFAYAWGKCFASFSVVKSQPVRDYNETIREVGYSPQEGVIAKINEYSLDPSAINPGGSVKFNANYYVMTPSGQKDISVTETRILKKYDEQAREFKEIGRADETLTVAPGLRRADGKIDIYEKVEEGKYLIGFMVTSEDKSDIAEMPLTITKDRQILAMAKKEHVSRVVKHQKEAIPGEKAIQPIKEKTLLIIAEKVNLREEPNTKAKIIGTASKDEKYPLVEQTEVGGKKWYRVRLDDGRIVWLIGTAAKIMGE